MIEALLLTLCCALLGAAVVFDLVRREIPNTIPLVILGLFAFQVAAAGHQSLTTMLWTHVVTAVVLLAIGFVLFLTGALGAGDGKLMAAAALWLGPTSIGTFLFGVGLLGLGLGLFCLLPFDTTRRLRSNIPFAVAIAPPAIALLALRIDLVLR